VKISEHGDAGRLWVMPHETDWLARVGWDTFEGVWEASRTAAVAKQLRDDRVTVRLEVHDPLTGQQHAVYVKRHTRPPARDLVKDWIRLRRPLVGARPEWEALQQFHQAGLPTMEPILLGERGGSSLLMTRALDGCEKLSAPRFGLSQPGISSPERERLLAELPVLTQSMHRSGLHHQDYYLGHLFRRRDDGRLFIIDLGRARRLVPLSRHWIVKDLAQLRFSAGGVTDDEWGEFLTAYLGHETDDSRGALERAIDRKVLTIARHSAKHRL
jgi:heptose I phosphotransferase